MKRGFLAPEVVQSSAMDCGPAGLKCLLEGFGIHASYGRLREACQTDVDGTSIDTLEQIALQLGLQAEQIMVPLDHVLLASADVFPSIVVVALSMGLTHFVVAWRRHGHLIQLMDPAVGRRWVTAQRFRQEIYAHTATVPADGWREWAGSDSFLNPLRERLSNIGVNDQSIDTALYDPTWTSLAALDAATRMTTSMVAAGALRRGPEAAALLARFVKDPHQIPPNYWCVQPADDDQLRFRGAVLLHVTGASQQAGQTASRELIATLQEQRARPSLELLKLLRTDGLLTPLALALAMFIAAVAVTVEALLFRGILSIGHRFFAIAALVSLSAALLMLEFPLAAQLLRIGRSLEVRLRLAFFRKIPLLSDRYFQSRLTSDMAERSHSIHQIRHLGELGGQLTRATFELLLTTAGIVWIDPASAPWAIASAAIAFFLSLIAQPPLVERDLRVRSHLGALSRFYLDGLLGLVAIRAHSAERNVRREHEGLLLDWARAGLGLQRMAVTVDAIQFFSGFGLAAALLFAYLNRGGNPSAVLLLVYWALNLPVLGQEIAQVAWQYPAYRNLTLRLMEPLGAPEESQTAPQTATPTPHRPAAIQLDNVTVRAAGHSILENINLEIHAGSHVAIVGPSGAGKSSLVGLLLGWHRAVEGSVDVDGLDRSEIAWVDPAVQLWNRSLAENLTYGNEPQAPLAHAIETADLREVLQKLPDGLDTPLGEGGALVSGGEGQRVRLGRALLRPNVRLVILDEPFRGLSREQRRDLLSRARRFWKDATLICITHDVGETLSFPRVLVIDAGRLVEDGAPSDLAAQTDSRYREMLDADRAIRENLWSDDSWRRIRLEDGVIEEQGATWVAT
ncbi:MAG: ATP-binding cassette domain-containing protein [Bryobacteraceae bacterium]